MKIIITQENLKNALMSVSRVVGNSSTLPILNNVLLETEEGLLKISGTNLETGISAYARCSVEKDGGVCIGVKTITDLINSLPNGNITIESKELETIITTEHTNLSVKHLSTEDFPLIPKIENGSKIIINAQDLKKGLDQVIFAASNSETQPEISGILFWFGEDNVLITATDRYRLAEKTIPYQGKIDLKIIIPHRSGLEITRLLTNLNQDIEINLTTTQLSITLENTYLVTRLIDGQYPDYQQIIPEKSNTNIILDKLELMAALKTTSVFSRGNGSINLEYNSETNLVKLFSEAHDLGQGAVEIISKINGESGQLIINYRYLLDYLNNLDTETIVMKIIDSNGPVTFVPENNDKYLYLVMPIKQ
ncbi:MAG TPA: DNA polymerase III subunit beta [Candidatus Doudnabacteria bacterium]|nr:DNA polymerase III subunit beta [Candidatus Doudnabacteria bacterium]